MLIAGLNFNATDTFLFIDYGQQCIGNIEIQPGWVGLVGGITNIT